MALAEPIWTLGERMWKARKDKGLEQTEVAKALGVSRALVSRWERDLSDPGARKLREFAGLTDVTTEWLMSTHGYIPDDGFDRSLTLLHGSDRPRPMRPRSPLLASVTDD